MEIFIYKIQNKINGMCYIGLTNDPQRRWSEHINGKTNSLIYKAIQRYGVEHFSFTILERGIVSYALAAEREKHYIRVFNSFEHGYNQTRGGETPENNPYKKNLYIPKPAITPIEKARNAKRKELNRIHKRNQKAINKRRNK